MSALHTFYHIKKIDDKTATVTICRNKPLVFDILSKYEEDVKEVFSSHSELLNEDKSVSLFETESIFDYIQKSWLYDEIEWKQHHIIMKMSGGDITTLFVDYILHDKVPSWLEVCRYYSPDEMASKFDMKSCSDASILDELMFLSFDNREGKKARISTQRADSMSHIDNGRSTSEYHFNKGVNWNAIIAAVRERYSLGYEEDKDISYAIAIGVERFVKGLAPHNEEAVSKIKSLANTSSSFKSYRSAVKNFMEANNLTTISNGGGCGSIGEGYSMDYNCGFSKGSFTIKIENIILSYRDEKEFDMQDMFTVLQTFSEDTLWKAVYDQYSTNLFS